MRIIGGKLRGRPVIYHGEAHTRPMKDRVREAAFNLVGTSVRGALAIDLFAGTGALALEAISRGADRAICLERHFPTVRQLEANVAELGVADKVEVIPGDTFFWGKRLQRSGAYPTHKPWVVFCSPPYALYNEEAEQVDQLLEQLWEAAPAGSTFCVESDATFDVQRLPATDWDTRHYAPAHISIARKPDLGEE